VQAAGGAAGWLRGGLHRIARLVRWVYIRVGSEESFEAALSQCLGLHLNMGGAEDGEQLQPPRLPPDGCRAFQKKCDSQDPGSMPDSIATMQARRGCSWAGGTLKMSSLGCGCMRSRVSKCWCSGLVTTSKSGASNYRRSPTSLAARRHSARSLACRIHDELINVLNVLGWLVDLEPRQASLLEKICTGPTISEEELRMAGALEVRQNEAAAQTA